MSADEVEQLFERARALDADARTAFLDEACRNDPALRADLESLLAESARAEAFFEQLARNVRFSSDMVTELIETSPDDDRAPRVPTPHVVPGETIGHYRIIGCVGTGGMGAVYRARDTRLDRDVALKFLTPAAVMSARSEERLLVEAKAAAALDHVNICAVHEFSSSSDGRPFIAMALYDGETLKDRLRRGAIPPDESVAIIVQIARALEAAHARGIVHRDVKPGNVIITAEGTVKLLDFGLARLADATLTRQGSTPGTLAYMSPEQVRGEPIDSRADLWSLGVVLYELLAGVRPFRGGNDSARIDAIVHQEPPALHSMQPGVPRPLCRVVERLLRKNPDDRYGSATEVLADLSGSTGVRRGVRASPRLRWIGAATAATAALLLAAIVVALPGMRVGRAGSPLVSAATGAGPAIAVLPFTVHGLDLDVWREGMVDLLSVDLDGAGGLRAIDSRTLLARWHERVDDSNRADLALALDVARETDAAYALLGSVVEAGPQLRLVAEVHDLASGTSLGPVRVEGAPDSILALVDRLAIRALGVVLDADPGELEGIDVASMTTRSLPVLKSYLDGQARYRRSDFAGASLAMERAVAADSLFALAWAGLAEAYAWGAFPPDGGVRAFDRLERAYRLADRLPARDAELLRAKWKQWHGDVDGLLEMEDIVRRHPDDADAWYELGDANYHNIGAMQDPAGTRAAFERATALQPRSAPYRAHLIELAFEGSIDSIGIARELDAYAALVSPSEARLRTGRMALALGFGDAATRQRARAAIDSLDLGAAIDLFHHLRHPRFSAERPAVFRRIRLLADGSRQLPEWDRFVALGITDGRVASAIAALGDPRVPEQVRACGLATMALHGIPMPVENVHRLRARTRADSSASSAWAYVDCAASDAAHHGRWSEHAALLSVAREMVARSRSAGDSAAAHRWTGTVREVEAHALWAKGQRAEALERFQGLATEYLGMPGIVWSVGQLSFELGHLEGAERAFRMFWYDPVAQLYLGRIYRRLGRASEAAASYTFVVEAWRNADPALEPVVTEARREIARLTTAGG